MDTPQVVRQLQAQLAAREQEVVALREIAEAASELQSADVQAGKVIEMSKKNRALNLQLSKEQHKVAKLQQALSEAAASSKQGPGTGPSAAAADEERSSSSRSSRELSDLKERLQAMTNRQGQLEQKVYLLEGENKKLVRALVREVGEEVPLQRVLQDETGTASDWKGRREQIIALKNTIKQLREAAGSPTAGAAGCTSAGAASLAKHESAHRSIIGRLNKAKDAELQRMAAELEAAKGAAEQLRLQFTGASSRRKVLEAEVAGLKDKLAVVLGKAQNDDKLIGALRAELVAVTRGGAGKGGGAGLLAAAGGEDAPHAFDLSQQRCSQLEEQVEQQQKIIRQLQAHMGGSNGQQQAAALQELRQENAALQEQLAEGMHRPTSSGGSGGVSAALRQQVLTLQVQMEDNAALHAQLQHMQPEPSGLSLTPTDMAVLEAAKEAIELGGSASGLEDDEGEADEREADEGDVVGGGKGSEDSVDEVSRRLG